MPSSHCHHHRYHPPRWRVLLHHHPHENVIPLLTIYPESPPSSMSASSNPTLAILLFLLLLILRSSQTKPNPLFRVSMSSIRLVHSLPPPHTLASHCFFCIFGFMVSSLLPFPTPRTRTTTIHGATIKRGGGKTKSRSQT